MSPTMGLSAVFHESLHTLSPTSLSHSMTLKRATSVLSNGRTNYAGLTYVRGPSVRYVHIPDEVSIGANLAQYVSYLRE